MVRRSPRYSHPRLGRHLRYAGGTGCRPQPGDVGEDRINWRRADAVDRGPQGNQRYLAGRLIRPVPRQSSRSRYAAATSVPILALSQDVVSGQRQHAEGGEWRPKVLVVPASYFADDRTIGGGERYAHSYASALAEITPTTLGLFAASDQVINEGALTVRTFRARSQDPSSWLPLPLETLREIGKFDVVHVMIYPTPVTDLIILNARIRGQTVVLTDVGGGLPSPSTYLSRIARDWSISRLANGFAFLSRHSAAQFGKWANPRTILYGGPGLAGTAVEDDSGDPYALFVGRLLPHKGVLELIRAMPAHRRLHIVGSPYDTAYREQLMAAAKDKRIRFFDGVDDEELRRQYSGARLVLQPSIPVHRGADDTSELLGMVALEGMAHSLPVIVTNAGSLPELVEDGVSGYITPAGDLEALGDRIERLMADRELATTMGEAARVRYNQFFSWPSVVEKGLSFYREVGG